MKATLPQLPDLNGNINLEPVRAHLRRAVQKVLQEPNDSAVLLCDAAICEPLVKAYLGTPPKAFAELSIPVKHYQALGAHGLDKATEAELPRHAHVVFLVHNSPANAQLVAQYLHEIKRLHERTGKAAAGTSLLTQQTYWLAAYPAVGLAFQKILTMANVTLWGDTKARSVPLHYFPLDRDLLTMHRPSALRELAVDNNPAILHEVAQSLFAFAKDYGLPQRIQAVGRHAVLVTELFRGAMQEAADSAGAQPAPAAMAKWIVFDRMADLCTPLMSQLTMEGRLDELQNTAAVAGWLPGERAADTDPSVASIPVLLHSSAAEWTDWRERHVQDLPQLHEHARLLDERRKKGAGLGASELWRKAVNVRALQRVLHHLSKDMLNALKPGGTLPEQHAAEMEFLERRGKRSNLFGARGGAATAPAEALLDLVLAGASFELCMRRLLLEVAMRGALDDKQFGEAVAILLDAFGHQHIHTLTNLEAAGMFVHKPAGKVREDAESSLAAMRMLFAKAEEHQRGNNDTLALSSLIAASEEMQATDSAATAAAYGRYRPISSLLVQHAMRRYMPLWATKHLQHCAHSQGQPSAFADVFGSYAVARREGADTFAVQRHDNEAPLGRPAADAEREQGHEAAVPRKMLVVMVGGCTYAEMTCLREVAAQRNVELVVFTTDVITGDRMLRSFMPASTELATADAAATMAAL